ncbi:hypothetical protein HG537_0H04180 [Torulaspora globosa]|uniref:Uncharacterized protein n=1 Tax=Torulaspora globosa TaxID=48254 RepID=A0A7H9I173_9SACH|nr:hypothetical protein HG537_0H04180 [Torulaspora sp. CBS 2947]
MLRDYGDASVSCNEIDGSAKRRGRDVDLEGSYAKRLKTESSTSALLTPAMLTPAATPAYAGVAETVSSPYSETEEYMLRGYYEDELVESNRTCIESVQYSLYDLTPEELEGESNRRDNDHESCTAANATIYEDSYDIDM